MVFLTETRSDSRYIDFVKSSIGFANGIGVGSRGRGGGIALLWNACTEVKILSYSKFHIDSYVGDSLNFWRLTGMYGRPKVENK